MKTVVNVPTLSSQQITFFVVGISKATDEKSKIRIQIHYLMCRSKDPDPSSRIWNTAHRYIEGKKKKGTTQESQRVEMAGVMARWREEVRNIQLEHQQEHRDLEEV